MISLDHLMEDTTINSVSWFAKMAMLEKKGRKEIKCYLEQATDESAFVGELVQTSEKDAFILLVMVFAVELWMTCLLNKNIDVYANRGANGIDGIVSNCTGYGCA